MPTIALAQLKSQALQAIYLIASDVTLLQQEARDALRSKAKKAHFLQRETHHVEPGFSGDSLFASLQNLNLFSEKTFVEVYNPSAKFDEKTVKQLVDYSKNPAPDKILLFLTEKLSAAQQKTRWYKAIESAGLCLNIRNIPKAERFAWITERAKQRNVKIDADSITLLGELTEGNLLATDQTLIKLTLLYPQESITREKLIKAVSDNARFTVFDLSETALSGEARQALRSLQGLKKSDTEPTLVLWSLCRELRELGQLLSQQQKGTSLHALLQKQWQPRKLILRKALSRLTLSKINSLLLLAEKADQTIKGLGNGNPWDILEQLILEMAITHENKIPHRTSRRHV